MRILHVTAHYPPDFTSGATLQVRRLAEAHAAAGHDVTVVSGRIAGDLTDGARRVEEVGAVTVHWLGTAMRIEQDDDANWRNGHAVDLVAGLVGASRPDVLHAHALQTLGADLLGPAVHGGVPVVVTMHDFWWWCPRLFLVDRRLRPCPTDTRASPCACACSTAARLARARHLAPILTGVDQVLVPSAVMRDVVVANGVDATRVDVDANDVDVAAVAAAPPAAGPDVRFLYVGGDHPLKGRDVVLDAARRLRRTPGWRLRLHGVPDAPRHRLPRPWQRPDDRVERCPAFAPQDAGRVYGAADVLVLPSVARESFSLAAREALASGLAVITSDCLGPTEVVHDGVNGLVVPMNDPAALAAAMAGLCRDRPRLARLQAAARAHPPAQRATAEHAASLVRRYEALGACSS